MSRIQNESHEDQIVIGDMSNYFMNYGKAGPSINQRYEWTYGPKTYFDVTPPDGDSVDIDKILVSDPVCMYTLRKPWKYMRLSGKPAYRLYTWCLNLIDHWFGFSKREAKNPAWVTRLNKKKEAWIK